VQKLSTMSSFSRSKAPILPRNRLTSDLTRPNSLAVCVSTKERAKASPFRVAPKRRSASSEKSLPRDSEAASSSSSPS